MTTYERLVLEFAEITDGMAPPNPEALRTLADGLDQTTDGATPTGEAIEALALLYADNLMQTVTIMVPA